LIFSPFPPAADQHQPFRVAGCKNRELRGKKSKRRKEFFKIMAKREKMKKRKGESQLFQTFTHITDTGQTGKEKGEMSQTLSLLLTFYFLALVSVHAQKFNPHDL
jgi:hypothetical protein